MGTRRPGPRAGWRHDELRCWPGHDGVVQHDGRARGSRARDAATTRLLGRAAIAARVTR